MKTIRNLLSDNAVDIAKHAEQACAGLRRHQRHSGGLNRVYLDSGGDRTPPVLIRDFGGDNHLAFRQHLIGRTDLLPQAA